MASGPDQKSRRERNRQKRRDAAALLPVLGIILLVTPLMMGFTSGNEANPLPRAVLYVFGVWGGLIVLAFCLARLLAKDDRDG
jgi:uncharacterized membrane protein